MGGISKFSALGVAVFEGFDKAMGVERRAAVTRKVVPLELVENGEQDRAAVDKVLAKVSMG